MAKKEAAFIMGLMSVVAGGYFVWHSWDNQKATISTDNKGNVALARIDPNSQISMSGLASEFLRLDMNPNEIPACVTNGLRCTLPKFDFSETIDGEGKPYDPNDDFAAGLSLAAIGSILEGAVLLSGQKGEETRTEPMVDEKLQISTHEDIEKQRRAITGWDPLRDPIPGFDFDEEDEGQTEIPSETSVAYNNLNKLPEVEVYGLEQNMPTPGSPVRFVRSDDPEVIGWWNHKMIEPWLTGKHGGPHLTPAEATARLAKGYNDLAEQDKSND